MEACDRALDLGCQSQDATSEVEHNIVRVTVRGGLGPNWGSGTSVASLYFDGTHTCTVHHNEFHIASYGGTYGLVFDSTNDANHEFK